MHKHPGKLQSVEISSGKAHIFYPEASEQTCTVALLLDIDPIGLVRNARNSAGNFALGHYVNDRPYVASSFMSVAIAKAFSTAMNGKCTQKPELVDVKLPFEVKISVLPAPKGGEILIRRLFQPLGYQLELQRYELDPRFSEWGQSRYFTLTLKGEKTVQELLKHLYVLIPVLDNDKHYWVSQGEVEKLLSKGEGWLNDHPEKEQIVKRYLRNIGNLTRTAMSQLTEEETAVSEEEEEKEVLAQKKENLHQKRLNQVLEELKASGAKRVVDLGCGEGKLLKLMLKEKQFEYILGVDVSFRELEKAKGKLHMDEMPPKQKERIALVQGALTYRDKRLAGYDAAAVVEVIEHLDPNRLKAFERTVFEFARPGTVVLTTPNQEYNALYETLDAGTFRHSDHRFEWTREEFRSWAERVASEHQYEVVIKPVGEEENKVGAPSQMAIFKVKGNEEGT